MTKELDIQAQAIFSEHGVHRELQYASWHLSDGERRVLEGQKPV